MKDLRAKALTYLKDHWHTGIARTADAAEFLDINPNTLKTRLARGQALVLRDPAGERRSTLTFTGYHLIYNLISDRLLRYGFPVEHDERGLSELAHVYAQWAYDKVLSPPHHTNAIVRFRKAVDGRVHSMAFEGGRAEDWTGDAALVLPIGRMVMEIAGTVYLRSADPEMMRSFWRQRSE